MPGRPAHPRSARIAGADRTPALIPSQREVSAPPGHGCGAVLSAQRLVAVSEAGIEAGDLVKVRSVLGCEGHNPSDTGVVEDDEPVIGAGCGAVESHGHGDRTFSAHRTPGAEARAGDDTTGQCPGLVVGGRNGAEDSVEFDCQGSVVAVHFPMSRPSGSVFIGRRGMPMVIHRRMLWWVIRWPVPLPLASRF